MGGRSNCMELPEPDFYSWEIVRQRQRGESPESLVTEAVMLFLDTQWPELYEPGPDPLVGLFAGPSDLATQAEEILEQEITEKSGWTWKRLASSGYVAQMDADLCAACGSCAEYCQFTAISVYDGLARIDAAVCMGCGVCVSHCPREAISLVRDPAKGEPLEIQMLIARAAQVTER
jgi:ferredoxin